MQAAFDVELVRAAQRGDLLAVARLMDSLAPFIGRICGGIALAQGEDAAQEALIQVLRDLRQLREPAALRAFARRIAVREAVRHARRAREPMRAAQGGAHDGARAGGGTEPGASGGPEALAGATSDPGLAMDVRAVLGALAPEQRAILLLRDLEGLSEEEAAEVLGVAKGTVKSRLSRAREAFARRWAS